MPSFSFWRHCNVCLLYGTNLVCCQKLEALVIMMKFQHIQAWKTFLNEDCCILNQILIFLLSVFLRVQLTNRHSFRQCRGTKWLTSYYFNQWWHCSLMPYGITRPLCWHVIGWRKKKSVTLPVIKALCDIVILFNGLRIEVMKKILNFVCECWQFICDCVFIIHDLSVMIMFRTQTHPICWNDFHNFWKCQFSSEHATNILYVEETTTDMML